MNIENKSKVKITILKLILILEKVVSIINLRNYN
jgi:hypothetical protein